MNDFLKAIKCAAPDGSMNRIGLEHNWLLFENPVDYQNMVFKDIVPVMTAKYRNNTDNVRILKAAKYMFLKTKTDFLTLSKIPQVSVDVLSTDESFSKEMNDYFLYCQQLRKKLINYNQEISNVLLEILQNSDFPNLRKVALNEFAAVDPTHKHFPNTVFANTVMANPKILELHRASFPL